MMKIACVVLVALLGLSQASYSRVSLGDRFLRDYTVYTPMPLTAKDALSQGWTNQSALNGNKCNSNLGYMFSYDSSGPTQNHPLVLFYTAAGQLSGSQVTIYDPKGKIPLLQGNLVNQGFLEKSGNGEYTITLAYRDPSLACSGSSNNEAVGDRLIINPNTIAYPLPVTENEAIANKFTKGACFYGMGYHYFFDLSTAPEMSWDAENLLPVVLMFNNTGHVQATFYTVAVKQQGVTNSHWWEPIALPNALMCQNWCDSSCTFPSVSFWSTMHTYFQDIDLATCANDCQTGCCP